LAVDEVGRYEVAMGEGAALPVLPRESDRDSLDDERRERERLGLAPVDAAGLDRLQASLELPHELRMDREPVRHLEQQRVQRAKRVGRNSGDHLAGTLTRDPAFLRPRLGERLLQVLV